MKLIIPLLLFFPLMAMSQKEKLYCDSTTRKGWVFEVWTFDGLFMYVRHNGKYYQDTTNTPPAIRLRQMMWSKGNPRDTTTKTENCDNLKQVVIKITECDSCPLKEIPAYLEVCHIQYWRQAIFEDTLTRKRYVSGNGMGTGEGVSENKYYDRNKIPFKPNIKIWDERH